MGGTRPSANTQAHGKAPVSGSEKQYGKYLDPFGSKDWRRIFGAFAFLRIFFLSPFGSQESKGIIP
jgi:hypothetical protein